MPHYQTKTALIAGLREERARLEKKLARFSEQQMTAPVMRAWSAKDILMHLVDWEQRFLEWYRAGLRGEKPEVPAPGMTWKDLSRINRIGFERHQALPLAQALDRFASSYQQILRVAQDIPEADLFVPGRYAWLGRATLAGFLNECSANHYAWARNQIHIKREWLKAGRE